MKFDPTALGKSVAELAKAYIDRRLDAMDARIASIPAGAKGDTGASGEVGPAGERGADGAPGPVGERGLQGAQGQQGPQGERGADGEPGRDAAQLDILAAIDTAKAYARGTWARHAGGLVRAYRNTDPIGDGDIGRAGWEVMVDGVKALHLEQSGERGFRVVSELTSGTKSAMECALPVLLDRGRYSEEKDYEAGDVVDWSGSMWIAQEASKGVEPRSDGKAWRLSVRRGRDGKDAIVRTVDPQRVKV